MITRTTPVAILAVILLVGATRPLAAQPANAEADALFEQGRELKEAGKLAEACAAFEASQRLGPSVSTILNLADCREKNQELAAAYGWYREAERLTRAPLDESTQNLNRVARERAKALADRLSKLTIDVAPDRRVPGLEVLRRSEPVEPGAWGRPLPIDGGTYEITARAPGHEPWTTTVTIAIEGDFQTVVIPPLVARPEPPAPIVKPPSKVVPIALAGGAVVLLGGALGLDLWARSEYRQAEREPDDLLQEQRWSSAKTRRYAAQGVAVAGVGCAGAAVWFYLRGRRAEARGVRVEPVLADDAAGIQLVGRY